MMYHPPRSIGDAYPGDCHDPYADAPDWKREQDRKRDEARELRQQSEAVQQSDAKAQEIARTLLAQGRMTTSILLRDASALAQYIDAGRIPEAKGCDSDDALIELSEATAYAHDAMHHDREWYTTPPYELWWLAVHAISKGWWKDAIGRCEQIADQKKRDERWRWIRG